MESRFSVPTRKINLIHLLWKSKLPKSTFSSKVCFVKLFINRKKVQSWSWKRREMHKNCFLDLFFTWDLKKVQLHRKNLLSVYISINSNSSFYPVLFLFLTSFRCISCVLRCTSSTGIACCVKTNWHYFITGMQSKKQLKEFFFD